MIRLTDATVLAFTKLRTRKIRTITTIIISALVFAILIAALSVSQGIFKSLADFSHEGLNDQYLVSALPAGMGLDESDNVYTKPELLARAKLLYDETVKAKKAYANELGISYDSATEPLPYMSFDGDPKNNRLSYGGVISTQVFAEYYADKKLPGLPELKKSAATYNPKSFLTSTYAGPQLITMSKGAETYPDPATGKKPTLQDDPLFSRGVNIAEPTTTKPFMMDSSWTPQSGTIPVIVTQSSATKLLDLKKLKAGATSDEQLRRIAEVRAKATSITFSACYRNEVSQKQIEQAVNLPNDIKKNASNKDYRQPAVQYQTPASDSCGAAVVTKDTRTVAEKRLDEKQQLFDERFGVTVQPAQQKISFQVVGITPDAPEYQIANAVDGLLTMLVGSSSLGATTIPQELYEQLPDEQRHEDVLFADNNTFVGLNSDPHSYAVHFSSADDARNFIDQQSCKSDKSSVCIASGTPFSYYAFGSNSIALADLQSRVTSILQIAALVAAGIAVVIMGGMIGRTIADGRRETAVFRAIGFKRFDITAVYTVYTLMLSSYVALLALILGLAAAFVLDAYYWSTLTVKAKLSFGASDPTREFHMFALDSLWLWLLAAAIILLGLIAMLIPLLRNVRRNPIKDMRDE